jgi:prepilin-type processing-associated H-X9-DG protein
LPPAAIYHRSSKEPLLSWRVAVLPYLGEGALFEDGFHAAFFDGHVRFIKNSIYRDEKALRALIGSRDGIRVELEAYP